MSTTEINLFDILSGKILQTSWATFYFEQPGYDNLDENGWPRTSKLRKNGICVKHKNGKCFTLKQYMLGSAYKPNIKKCS